MKLPQIILVIGCLGLLLGLYFWGKTVPTKSKTAISATEQSSQKGDFDFEGYMLALKKSLTPGQQQYLIGLENSVKRGDVKEQQIHVYHQLASFWRDTVKNFFPYMEYSARAARLENSEKTLTFAAHLYLREAKGVEDLALRSWMANQSKELFEQAEKINPNNDSTQVGLGASFIFGADGMPMEGIQRLNKVIAKDPKNMFAQFMLGYGGMISGQLDKAIQRFTTVVENEPENLEAMLMLADIYERKKDNNNAKKWYEAGKQLFIKLSKRRNEEPKKELLNALDERIKNLK